MKKAALLFFLSINLFSCSGQSLEIKYDNELTTDDVPSEVLRNHMKYRFSSFWKNSAKHVYDHSTAKVVHQDLKPSLIFHCKDKKAINTYVKLFSNNNWGLLDFNLKEVLPFKFDTISDIKEWFISYKTNFHYFEVEESNRIGLLNESLEYFIQPKYEYLSEPKDSFLIAKLEGKFGIIDLNDNIRVPFIYDTIEYTIARTPERIFFLVESNDKQGIVSSQNEMKTFVEWDYLKIITSFFHDSECNYEYIACNGKDGKYGLVSDSEKLTDLLSESPIEFTKCHSYNKNRPEYLYIFEQDEKQGIFNDKGDIIFEAEYDKIEEIDFDKVAEEYNRRTALIYNKNHKMGKHKRIRSIYEIPNVNQTSNKVELEFRLGLFDLTFQKGNQIDTLSVYTRSNQDIIFIPISLIKKKDN